MREAAEAEEESSGSNMSYDQNFMDAFDALNHLYAGYHARRVALALIHHYNRTEKLEPEIERSDRALEEIRQEARKLWEGTPLVLAAAPSGRSKEAAGILDLIEIMVRELESFADHLETIVRRGPNPMATPDLAVALAAQARAAYREYYLLQGFINFAQRMGRRDLLDHYEAMTPTVNYNYQAALALLERAPSLEQWPADQKQRLRIKAFGLPGLFRIMRVDLIELLRKILREPTEARFGMDPRVFAAFVQQGYAAYAAAAWLAIGFTPADAAAWRGQGLDHPGLANDWTSRGFSLSETAVWAAQGVPAEDAALRANKFPT